MKLSRLFLLLLSGAFVLSLTTPAFAERKQVKKTAVPEQKPVEKKTEPVKEKSKETLKVTGDKKTEPVKEKSKGTGNVTGEKTKDSGKDKPKETAKVPGKEKSKESGKEKSKDKKDKDKPKEDSVFNSGLVSGLKFRSIGPAFCSGRIADFAVNPKNHSEWFVAVASGHVWKTVNNGTTFEPVFENNGTYSIGCVIIDPNNSNVVWVGTGENNHQRSLGYGNGVYKSFDNGKSWKNMGLKDSRQIGKILIDPRNSDVVYVAAEGSVWGPGGERGLYKTIDGGTTWKKILEISENTGVNNVILDPRNPDVLYASSEQRRRHVFTKIGGGPETAIYKRSEERRVGKECDR
jgi:hypothetical protein